MKPPRRQGPGVFFADESSRPELPRQTNYEDAERLARAALPALDLRRQAERTGCRLTPGGLALEFFDQTVQVAFPGGEVTDAGGGGELPIWERILLLHYVASPGADRESGDPGTLVGFANVPSGMFYLDAFRRRAHLPLAGMFGRQPALLLEAGALLGGEPVALGDAAVKLIVLPRIPVTAVVHAADEELPAEAKLLFAASITSHLCAEDIAVIGGMVAGRLIRAARKLSGTGGR